MEEKVVPLTEGIAHFIGGHVPVAHPPGKVLYIWDVETSANKSYFLTLDQYQAIEAKGPMTEADLITAIKAAAGA